MDTYHFLRARQPQPVLLAALDNLHIIMFISVFQVLRLKVAEEKW